MIEDPNWRARAVLDRSKKLFAWDEVRASIELYNSFDGVGMSDSKLFEEIREHELLLQAVIGNVEFIKSKKASGWRAPVARQAVGVY